jgi:hypothetical protein
MKARHQDVRKIEDALIHFHRQPVPVEVDQALEQKVMGRIREESVARRPEPENGFRTNKLIWRFALVTCIVALLFAVYVIKSDLDTQYRVAELMLEDLPGLELARAYGML